MGKKTEDGVRRTGHLIDSDDGGSDTVAVQFDGKGAIITWPREADGLELFQNLRDDREVPLVLHYRDHQGYLTFEECQLIGSSVSSLGAGVDRIRSARIVESGRLMITYDDVDGMTTEIDGLATWAEMSTIHQSVEADPEKSRIGAVVIRAQNPEPIPLGGRLNLTLQTAFTHKPTPVGNVFSITDLVMARTQSDVLMSREAHAATHRMLQDLMCLAYGKACLMRMKSVKREDDQPYLREGDTRRTWRDVYEPTFGRTEQQVKALDRTKDRPLFMLRDTDPSMFRAWIDNYDHWARPTWIAVTTMFQSGTTVEARLLQLGVALESLGYALWLTTHNQDAGSPTRTPTYLSLLKEVTDAIGFEHDRMYGNSSAASWRSAFNRAFKGAKHADNPLPEPVVAHTLANQAFMLIRCWIAIMLGVPITSIQETLNRH